MTTPTREQVIEQAIQGHASTRMAMQWLYEHALKEGRDQGLMEAAAKVRAILADCEQQDIDDPELEVIAAIEQLRA